MRSLQFFGVLAISRRVQDNEIEDRIFTSRKKTARSRIKVMRPGRETDFDEGCRIKYPSGI